MVDIRLSIVKQAAGGFSDSFTLGRRHYPSEKGHDLNYVVRGSIRAATPTSICPQWSTRPGDICQRVQLATGYGQKGILVVEPFRIHVADEVLDDLRARLRNARWPDQIPGIGWKQGTELDWLRRLVSYWADEFDWRGWERRLNAFHHFTWEGIHFVYQRAASGRGVPLILTHGWPSSFLDYMDMLPMLDQFDVVIPSLPGYGFSPRPPQVGINYRFVSERWHRLMSDLGYSRYGASGYDFGAG